MQIIITSRLKSLKEVKLQGPKEMILIAKYIKGEG
jgi:hypothetical protein